MPPFKRQLSLECRLELVVPLMNRIKQNLWYMYIAAKNKQRKKTRPVIVASILYSFILGHFLGESQLPYYENIQAANMQKPM